MNRWPHNSIIFYKIYSLCRTVFVVFEDLYLSFAHIRQGSLMTTTEKLSWRIWVCGFVISTTKRNKVNFVRMILDVWNKNKCTSDLRIFIESSITKDTLDQICMDLWSALFSLNPQLHVLLTWVNFNRSWISNRSVITCRVKLLIKGYAVEVWAGISNFITHFTGHVFTYPLKLILRPSVFWNEKCIYIFIILTIKVLHFLCHWRI